jgi:hypothetical protein
MYYFKYLKYIMENLGKEFISGTQSLGKAQMTVGFYIFTILAVVSFIGIIAVTFMYKFGWKKAVANVNSISCSTGHTTQTVDNQTTTKTTHPSTYSVSWTANGVTKNSDLTSNTINCTECTGPGGCSPSTVDIIYNPKNPSDVSLKSNTKMILILVLFTVMVFFIIGAVIDRVFRNNKTMQTLTGFETGASLINRII